MERAQLARCLGATPADASDEACVRVETADPATFMAAFRRGVAGTGAVLLSDPYGAVANVAEAARIAGEMADRPPQGQHGWLLIPTGGTSGRVAFARHDGATLAAAVTGFCRHFGFKRVHAVNVLPMHHVSGLMPWIRSAMTGGEFVPWGWQQLKAGWLPAVEITPEWVISLVPTQLQRLLELPETTAWLRRFGVVFVGGGPVWPALADAAASARIRVSLSYGATETAAMVAALQPEEFLAGTRSCGRPLPHVDVSLNAEGVVVVRGASLHRGYYPATAAPREWQSEDLATIDAAGHLHVFGRRDAVIITGGKKVHPAEVEAALRGSGEFADVAVVGVPHPAWGESVVACYPGTMAAPDPERATLPLAAYQRPKRFIAISPWPRNAQGKLNRAALITAVHAALANDRGPTTAGR